MESSQVNESATAPPRSPSTSSQAPVSESPSSPSLTTDSGQHQTIPHLPTELQYRIIELTLPAVSISSFRQLYDVLLVYSRVHSTWRNFAQEVLFKNVYLQNLRALNAYATTPADLRVARKIHLVGGDAEETGLIPMGSAELHSALNGVRDLVCQSIEINEDDLSAMSGLTTLHLSFTNVGRPLYRDASTPVPPTPGTLPVFGSLTTLCLVDSILHSPPFPTCEEFLNPQVFPALRRFAFVLTETATTPDGQSFAQALASIAGQLESFAFGQGDAEAELQAIFPNLPWDAFHNLKDLALYPDLRAPQELIPDSLRNIPSALSTLRVTSIDQILHTDNYGNVIPALLEVLREDLAALRELKLLTFEGRGSVKDYEDEAGLGARVEQIGAQMSLMGGEFVFRDVEKETDETGKLHWEPLYELWR